jgi:two-component system response regulator RegX3
MTGKTRLPRLLIVEDEAAIRDGLVDVFVYHGFGVDSCGNGVAGLEKALTGRYDLVLLDIMLPGMNGFDVCDAIRAQDRNQPIIMLTAKSSDEEIIHGLKLGADDYVAKPFSIQQLVLRVKAVLRRSEAGRLEANSITLMSGVVIDTHNLNGRAGDDELAFTRREIDILQYLAAHSARAVSREELLNKVWGYARNLGIETRTVDIHVAKLRRKIEANPKEPGNLITVRRAGYRLLLASR